MSRALLPALALCASLLTALPAPPASGQETVETAETAETAEPADPWVFPQELRAGGQTILLHEPTVRDHDPEAGAIALSVPLEVRDPLGRIQWGATTIQGTAKPDLSSSLFRVDAMSVDSTLVPGLADDLHEKLTTDLPGAWPERLILRLELITARVGAVPAELPDGKLNRQPPEIHVLKTNAVLVQMDGDPEFQPVKDFRIEYVINSAADLFRDREGVWYFLLDGHWATAKELTGPWTWLDGKLPITMTQIPIDHPRGHVRRWIPGTKRYKREFGTTPPERPESLPEIIVATKPAELVLLHGDPLFTLVPGVKLMVVANTESDLFFHPRSAKYYLLLSGRWFISDEIESGWGPAFGTLPEEFGRIPADHGKSHALWCVPGTPQAQEAIARARLPERAALRARSRPRVRYEGKKPQSAPIDGTEARRVTNTEDDVLTKGNAYFACIRGAWFRSDDGLSKWTATEELPDWLSVTLPESSGMYHANFCRARGADDKGMVFEVTGEYSGVFIEKGVPVYGTGWFRRGLLRNRNWYPCARTYGENRWYDPVAGCFQPRSVRYGEGGGARASLFSPYTASYARVRYYADRFRQGGRRMFAFSPGDDEWDLDGSRGDAHGSWGTDVLRRNGIPLEELPLGNRAGETSPDGPAVVCNAEGQAFRLGEHGIETWVAEGKWSFASEVDDTLKAEVEALDRIRRRPDELNAWAAKRRAPLPINPVITPAK